MWKAQKYICLKTKEIFLKNIKIFFSWKTQKYVWETWNKLFWKISQKKVFKKKVFWKMISKSARFCCISLKLEWLERALCPPAGLRADRAALLGPSLQLLCDALLPFPPGSPDYNDRRGPPCVLRAPPSGGPPCPAAAHEARWAASGGPGCWSDPENADRQASRTSRLCRSESGWAPGCWWRAAASTFQCLKERTWSSVHSD